MDKAKKGDSRYRERRIENADSLKIEQKSDNRPSTAGLKLDTSFDISQLPDLTGTSVDLTGVTGKVKPQGGDGLQIDTDLGQLSEGVRRIHVQQKSAELQALIEEAQTLIEQEKFRPALKVLNKAQKADPTSALVLFLKGFCFFQVEQYDDALEVLDNARQYAAAPETLVLILALHAACERWAVEATEAKLRELIEKKQSKEALALVERELAKQPSSPALLYFHCGILLVMDKVAEAKRAIADAQQRVSGENAKLFDGLLAQVHLKENHRHLEAARSLLRRNQPTQALTQLNACRAVLGGVEEYENMRSYAYERSNPGMLGGLFARDKPQRLSEPARQHVLQWLLSEELEAGSEGLKAERFAQAMTTFSAAGKIDPRCGIICFLHAVAIFQGFQHSLENEKTRPDLDQSVASLTNALELLSRSGVESAIAEPGQALYKVIRGYLSQLHEVSREAQPVNDVMQKFEELMKRLEQHPISSHQELTSALRQFHDIRQRADRLRQGRVSHQARETLNDLISAIDDILRRFTEVTGR